MTRRAIWVALILLIVSVGLLFFNTRLYYPFIADDALISLRYASRLLHGHGLSWTDGPPVEGYSNLLWVLLVAALGLVRLDLIDAARVLGFLSIAAILWVLLVTYVRRGGWPEWLPASVGLLFVSLSAPIGVWAIGGLEQPLVGGLLAASISLMFSVLSTPTSERLPSSEWLTLSAIFGLLSITRPDGPLFAVAAIVTVLLAGPGRGSTRLLCALTLLIFPAISYGGQVLFRFFYYGGLVPNTALVKLAFTAARRTGGRDYVWSGLRALSPFSFLAIAGMVGLLMAPEHRKRATYLLALSAIWSAYVVVIGGDIFPAYRHLVPLIVVFAFALIELGLVATRFLKGRPWVTTAVFGIVLAQFPLYAQDQYANKQSQRAVTERWEWQCKDLGVFLKTAFSARQPLLAVTAAGCLPYWSELPSLDMLGLNDYYLPRHPPPDLGNGFLGHELGDGAYVLGRRPDLIVFSVGSGPSFRGGIELDKMAEFHERYIPVTVHVDGLDLSPLIFFDRYSAKVGIRESASVVTIPGFLFRSERTVAHLSGTGALVTSLTREEPVRLTFASEARPDWEIQVLASHADSVTARVEHGAGTLTITLSTTQPDPVDIETVTLVRAGSSHRDALAR
jgi:hypothetical protein